MHWSFVYNWEGKHGHKYNFVKRPLSRPKLTEKDSIMRDVMELILYCASFVTHDVEMLGGYAYHNVILLRRVVVQYCPVLLC